MSTKKITDLQLISALTGSENFPVDDGIETYRATPSQLFTYLKPKFAPNTDELSNLAIAVSVSSNALTVALKNQAGNDPSSSDPVRVSFRSSTLTSGTYLSRSITGALSMTVSSGSTLGHASGETRYIYVYLIDNAGTPELAVSTKPFDQGSVISTTAEGGSGGATSSTVAYSTSARTSVAFRLIARLKSNQTVAGTWAAVPSEVSLWPFEIYKGQNEVWVLLANGYGSTNTTTRRWTNIQINKGTAITYADSATLGGSFTINESGVYSIMYGDQMSTTNWTFGISLNSTQLATAIQSITAANRIAEAEFFTATQRALVTATLYLKAGDVIRGQTDGTSSGAETQAEQFRIVKVSQ